MQLKPPSPTVFPFTSASLSALIGTNFLPTTYLLPTDEIIARRLFLTPPSFLSRRLILSLLLFCFTFFPFSFSPPFFFYGVERVSVLRTWAAGGFYYNVFFAPPPPLHFRYDIGVGPPVYLFSPPPLPITFFFLLMNLVVQKGGTSCCRWHYSRVVVFSAPIIFCRSPPPPLPHKRTTVPPILFLLS